MGEVLTVATRGGNLAVSQTEIVIAALKRIHPNIEIKIKRITTKGDRDRRTALWKLRTTGFFTSQVEDALLEGNANFAVHSFKDLPTRSREGLKIAAILDRRLLRMIYRRSPSWIRSRLFDRMYDQKLGLNSFDSVIDEIGKAVDALKSRMGLNFLAFLGIAFHWSTGSITAYLAALSLGCQINFWFIVVIYAIVEFIQQLNVVIPGGLGVLDAGLTGAFVLIGIPLSLASAISLLTRLATYWLEFVLAGFVSIYFGYKESLKDYPINN